LIIRKKVDEGELVDAFVSTIKREAIASWYHHILLQLKKVKLAAQKRAILSLVVESGALFNQ
jgi:hypothetical protein